jgi:hypothetical protein
MGQGQMKRELTCTPRINDFLLNTWKRVNRFALPHRESEELPNKIQKIP